MTIDYDIEKINSFLRDFHNTTGLTISLWDVNINQLGFQPEHIPDFCRLVKSSPEGRRRCLMSDQEVCGRCRTSLSPLRHRCHAGLTDSVVPIILDGRLFGFMMFGQIQGNQDGMLDYSHFEKLGQELSLPPLELYAAYQSLKTFDLDKVASASRILSAAARYLFNSGSIQYTEHKLINGIEEYIQKNITKTISVSEICAYFGINKNRLYMLWETHFGTTIGKYILDKRMELAGELLTKTERKINSISADVGIPDYNYFTKVFKKYYGIPPKDYRRMNCK